MKGITKYNNVRFCYVKNKERGVKKGDYVCGLIMKQKEISLTLGGKGRLGNVGNGALVGKRHRKKAGEPK